ncbi:hypothetical protein J7K50_02660 [bacterium]|nr:hypothetical protein [bacterium]
MLNFFSNWVDVIGVPGEIIGYWIAVGLTLCMLSFLYKDNPFFKLAEHLYLGISNGYWLVYVWQAVIKPELLGRIIPTYIFDPLEQTELYNQDANYLFILPGLLGLFLLLRLIPALGWLSRWSLAFYIGWGAGVAIPTYMANYILRQATATFTPLFGMGNGEPYSFYINNWLIFVGVLSALVYFFFSVEHKGVVGHVSKVGIWTLMLAFGASFGSTVMARVSLFIGRARFLIEDGGSGTLYYPFYIQLALIIIMAVILYFVGRGKGPAKPEEGSA